MKFETKRLIIRPIALDDKTELFDYRSGEETNKYQGWIPKTMSDGELFIGKVSRNIDEPNTQIERYRSTVKKLYGFHRIGEVLTDNF